MGSISAIAFNEEVQAGRVALDAVLSWHLSSNHFPTVPAAFIATCAAALEAGHGEDWDAEIALPKGCNTHHRLIAFNATCESENCDVVQAVDWKDGRPVATAGDLIESFHLDSFL